MMQDVSILATLVKPLEILAEAEQKKTNSKAINNIEMELKAKPTSMWAKVRDAPIRELPHFAGYEKVQAEAPKAVSEPRAKREKAKIKSSAAGEESTAEYKKRQAEDRQAGSESKAQPKSQASDRPAGYEKVQAEAPKAVSEPRAKREKAKIKSSAAGEESTAEYKKRQAEDRQAGS